MLFGLQGGQPLFGENRQIRPLILPQAFEGKEQNTRSWCVSHVFGRCRVSGKLSLRSSVPDHHGCGPWKLLLLGLTLLHFYLCHVSLITQMGRDFSSSTSSTTGTLEGASTSYHPALFTLSTIWELLATLMLGLQPWTRSSKHSSRGKD